jgi:hypothetical protein
MRSTRIADLLAPFVVLGLAVYALMKVVYADLPPLHYLTSAPLAVLAIAELVTSRRVRAVVRHEPHARPMAAIVIARCVALGKASSLVGAGLAGACVGLLAYLLPDADLVHAAASDARVVFAVLGAAVLLTVAGLALERSGIDPNRSERERERDT